MQISRIAILTVMGVYAAVFAIACNDVVAAHVHEATSAVETASTKQARFTVEGMTCGSCNVAVKVAAEKVDGVSKAGASHEKKTAWAVYDPTKTNPKAIAAAITKAGFKTTPVE